MPATRPTLDTEWSILLAACSVAPNERTADRIHTLLQSRFDGISFDLATAWCGAAVYQTLQTLSPLRPRFQQRVRYLRDTYHRNVPKGIVSLP